MKYLRANTPFASIERTAAMAAGDFTMLRRIGLYFDDLVLGTAVWTVERYRRSLH